MGIPVFQTQLGPTDGFCGWLKSIPHTSVKLCSGFEAMQNPTQFLTCQHCICNLDHCGEKKPARVKNFRSHPEWPEPCSTDGTQLCPGTPKIGDAGVMIACKAQDTAALWLAASWHQSSSC